MIEKPKSKRLHCICCGRIFISTFKLKTKTFPRLCKKCTNLEIKIGRWCQINTISKDKVGSAVPFCRLPISFSKRKERISDEKG